MFQERFQPDQRVIFRREGAKWFEGRITGVNDNGESYRVQEYEAFCEPMKDPNGDDPPILNRPGNSYTIQAGYENLRVLPKEKSALDRMFEAFVTPPIFKDPFAHLYVPKFEANEFDCVEGIGTILHSPFPPEEETKGIIEEEDLREMIACVPGRQKLVKGGHGLEYSDASDILKSILPKERDISRLEELAETDPEAMLQLADVYRYGLFGIEKDRPKAQHLYMCAALGLSQEEFEANKPFDWKFAYPMGTSEALCASAQEMWLGLSAMCNVENQKDYSQIIVHLRAESMRQTIAPWKVGILKTIVPFLGHAIRRGWTCPFAMAVAAPLREHQFFEPFLPDSMQLINALECEEVRTDEDKAAFGFGGKNKDEYSVPSAFQLERFKPKATKIFLDLPAKAVHGRGNHPSDIHVEYREMAFPPYPIVVMALNPQTSYNYGHIQIPEEFVCTPFSKGAFEYIWSSLVFNSMHRGDFRGGQRFRPTVITFADKPGDRLFASYVKNAIGGNSSGTEIRIVNTKTYKVRSSFLGNTTIHGVQERLESSLNTSMKGMMSGNPGQFRTPTEQAATRFNNRTDMPAEELLTKVDELKQEGNRFFTSGRMQPAKRCYTEAIDLIQVNATHNDSAYVMLATLLSNRAACFLKMAEGMSPDSAKSALKNSLADCEKALKNRSCMRVVSDSIRGKLQKRKETATTRINRLVSQSSNLMLSEYMGVRIMEAGQQDQQQQQQQQTQRQQRRGPKNSRRGRKKKKLQRRRKQRQQRNQQQDQREEKKDDSEEEEEHEEDGHELISILMGKELWESGITPFVNGREDTCPCCFDRFSVELADTFCAVNSCGHAYCLPCLSILRKKSTRGSDPIDFNCPVCRIPIHDEVLSDAVDPIISCTQSLQNRIRSLPLREAEGKQVARELLLRHDFKIADVLSALDSMLTDGLQASLRSSKELSPSQKQEIYEKARKPVDVLWAEAKELYAEMNAARDLESDDYIGLKKRLNKVQNTLIPAATKAAIDYIWEQLNTAGKMGVQDAVSGEIEIDFHALHVHEAKERFNEQVLPILPAVESILLVVGRGNHSEGGNAKLKPALKRHIDNHSKMRYSHVEGNDGMIRVRWIH